MKNKKKICCIIGTRPEAIKMAPVVKRLAEEDWTEVKVIATAQHRDLLDQVLNLFQIVPDIDLDIMRPDQSLPELTARLLCELDKVLLSERPHAVLAQGDTTSVLSASLACYYQHIPFGHIEAGLRTWDLLNPFPEEMNRVVASRLTQWHFAPTETAKKNLLHEHVAAETIFVTGNTVIDALLQTSQKDIPLEIELGPGERLILVTAHRRENFGPPLQNICRAILALVKQNSNLRVLFPVHPNPNVGHIVYDAFGQHPRIHLCPPLDYGPFVSAMKKSYLILTDSGGVQEEAPALGKPVLVLRSETERPEAIDEGVVKLVGTEASVIVKEAQQLLDDDEQYNSMAKGVSPYGDGKAAGRIVDILETDLMSSKKQFLT